MSVKIELNFDKPTISMGMIDILKNGLVEDPEQTLSKLTLVECITVLTKGKKLQVAPANYLLSKLMRMLSIEDSAIEDEIPLSGTQDLGKDLSMSQIMGEGGSKDPLQDLDNTQRSEVIKQSKSDETVKEAGDKSPNKKKDLCRFYARGHCTKKGDCRFDHPSICKVFRQFGDKTKDTKGCDGKCEAFHPNVFSYVWNHLVYELCSRRIPYTVEVLKGLIRSQDTSVPWGLIKRLRYSTNTVIENVSVYNVVG